MHRIENDLTPVSVVPKLKSLPFALASQTVCSAGACHHCSISDPILTHCFKCSWVWGELSSLEFSSPSGDYTQLGGYVTCHMT